jgi:hypothetical protein
MTVTVKLPDGGIDEYMRFGDAYIKHIDGTLEVVRNGVKKHFSYSKGEWTEIKGDEHRHKVGLFHR